jgi:hypothetical protein
MARSTSFRRTFLLILVLSALGAICVAVAQKAQSALTVEQVMTLQEMRESGISTLTATQKQAFNNWLNRYSLKLYTLATQQQLPNSGTSYVRSSCSPAIESTISGEIEGWDGNTVFKLDNGQIWQQTEYDYTYFYAYRPEVTIYQTSAGCRMKVEDETDTVLVKRIK